MEWKAHLAFGVFLGAVAAYLLGLNMLTFCALSSIGALLPDLDGRNSKASRLLYAALFALLAAFAFFSGRSVIGAALIFAAGAAILFAIDFLIRPRHRGVMHGFAFACLLGAVFWLLLGALPALALFIGYFSHLLADGCVKLI